MFDTSNIHRQDFDVYTCNSDGEPIEFSRRVSILYNTNVISHKEVEWIVNHGAYEWDYRILATTPETADALAGKKRDKDGLEEEECREL